MIKILIGFAAFNSVLLLLILKKQSKVMKELDDLKQLATDQTQEIADLRTSVNSMEAANAAAIQELKDIIANGGGASAAELQGVIDILQSNKQALADTKADVDSLDDDA